MQVLLMDRGVHLDFDGVRRQCPSIKFEVARNESEALQRCGEAEALVAMAHEVSDELVSRMPRLRYICAISAGVDRLETLKELQPEVRISTGRGIHGPQMSEMAFLYMIALSRDFPRLQRNQRNHLWERWPQHLLYKKTVAIAGIGPIAEELAARCVAFGMRVIGVSDARVEAPNFEKLFKRAQLPEAAREADFLIVLVPLSAQTRHLIDADVLTAMKPTAVLINLARGTLVDEAALVRCLQEGRIAGAALDVFEVEPLPTDSPLWDMPNVIITPRIGGMSEIYAQQSLPLVVHNLHCFAEGRLAEMKNDVRG